MDRVLLLDTTLRDGDQTPGVSFGVQDKVDIARALDAMGVDVIEAGFAASSPGDAEAVRAVSRAVEQAVVCSLARCVPGDIQAAAQALREAKKPRIHLFIATSDVHLQYKLHMTREQVLSGAREAVRLARQYTQDVEFSCEDATRSDVDFLCEVLSAAVAAGATTVNVPDTVGYVTVEEYAQLLRTVRERVPGMEKVVLSVHTHNDLGLAVATSLAGVRAGARQVECTVNGLGERAGNAALEEVVMGLRTRRDWYGADTNADARRIYRVCRTVSALSGADIAPNKPIVGANAFTHQSGIHQHGVLNNRATYEVLRPEELGVPMGGMTLSKVSGRHALAERAEQLGYRMTDAMLAVAFERFKELADRKKQITDRDVMAILREQLLLADDSGYQLHSFQVFSGNKMTATATVTLARKGDLKTRASCGDGPVEACFNAVNEITGLPCALESYNLKAVTEGRDALGEVTVRVRNGGDSVLGKGVSPDVIEASCLSYINAVNRMLALRENA